MGIHTGCRHPKLKYGRSEGDPRTFFGEEEHYVFSWEGDKCRGSIRVTAVHLEEETAPDPSASHQGRNPRTTRLLVVLRQRRVPVNDSVGVGDWLGHGRQQITILSADRRFRRVGDAVCRGTWLDDAQRVLLCREVRIDSSN